MLPTRSQEIQRSKLSREAYNKVKTFSNYFIHSRFLFNPIERERKRGKRSETCTNTAPEVVTTAHRYKNESPETKQAQSQKEREGVGEKGRSQRESGVTH